MDIDKLTKLVIEICIKIHSTIGPGCFEKVYEEILYHELVKRDIPVQRQLLMPIQYETLFIPDAYKLDLFVDNQLITELKSIEFVTPAHYKQLMTHLKLMNLKYGMLLNFKVNLMKEGIHRVFNNFGRLKSE
jgi:GxxExxY protein